VIYEHIRNLNCEKIGPQLGQKAQEFKEILDEKDKNYTSPQELKEFLKKRAKV